MNELETLKELKRRYELIVSTTTIRIEDLIKTHKEAGLAIRRRKNDDNLKELESNYMYWESRVDENRKILKDAQRKLEAVKTLLNED